MEKKEILERLNSVKNNKALTEDDKEALRKAISLVKRKNWKDNFFKIAELLVKIFGVGSKFIDP